MKRPPGVAKYSAKTESALEVLPAEAGSSRSRAGGTTRVVEVAKISCQGKVEVVKNIRWERNSERVKQSRVMGVPKIACQDNVDKIMESFDAQALRRDHDSWRGFVRVLGTRWPSLWERSSSLL